MDDSSNGRAVTLYPADPGSNPHSGSLWDHLVSATYIDGCIMSDKVVVEPTHDHMGAHDHDGRTVSLILAVLGTPFKYLN